MREALLHCEVESPEPEDIDYFTEKIQDQILASYSPSQIRNLLDTNNREELAWFFFERLVKPVQELDMEDIYWPQLFTYLRKCVEAVYRV